VFKSLLNSIGQQTLNMSSLFSNLRGEQREGAEAYYDSMKRLTSNDKNVINSLTEIAYENRSQAKIIVHVIEKRISMVSLVFLILRLKFLRFSSIVALPF